MSIVEINQEDYAWHRLEFIKLERDVLAAEVARLLKAIETHRAGMGRGGLYPNSVDQALWAVLALASPPIEGGT